MPERGWLRLSFFPLALAGMVVAGALALNIVGPSYDARSARITEASQLVTRAREAAGLNDWTQAKVYATKAVALNPDHVLGRLLLGLAYLNTNALDEAEAQFRRVLALAREDRNSAAWAHNNLGVVYRHRGQLTAAIREYETAIAADPSNGQARANLAEARRLAP